MPLLVAQLRFRKCSYLIDNLEVKVNYFFKTLRNGCKLRKLISAYTQSRLMKADDWYTKSLSGSLQMQFYLFQLLKTPSGKTFW